MAVLKVVAVSSLPWLAPLGGTDLELLELADAEHSLIARVTANDGSQRLFRADRLVVGSRLSGSPLPSILFDPATDSQLERLPLGPTTALVRVRSQESKLDWSQWIPSGAAVTEGEIVKTAPLLRLAALTAAQPPVGSAAAYFELDALIEIERTPMHDEPESSAMLKTTGWGSGSLTGKGVRVAVVDTGVNYHADLGQRLLLSKGVDVSDPAKVIFCDPTAKDCAVAEDKVGHGTAMAGFVAGVETGVARGAEIVPIKALPDQGCASSAALVRGITYAQQSESTIVLAAWTFRAEAEALRIEIEKLKGQLLVIGASGEGDHDLGAVAWYPPRWRPALDNLLVVGGLSRNSDWMGPTGKGYIDLAATGEGITTIAADHTAYDYRQVGTSVSAAVAAGAAALYLEKNANLSPGELRAEMTKSALKPGYFAAQCGECGILARPN